MITVRHAADRGRANFGWLDSKHTFSFGSYYDPQHMGFSELRVINDDVVKPGAGFDTHGHRDMEIISYVLEGVIAHKDSEGNVKTLPAGEFQLMSAGKGIYHSEYNASNQDTLRFLQIWIQPNAFGTKPGYQQKDFGRNPGLTTIATPTGENGTLLIKQDATLHQLILEPSSELNFEIESGRKLFIHQVTGSLSVDNTTLTAGDGAKIEHQSKVVLRNTSNESTTALLFDLP
ncbi:MULTISPECIES: pirin family protein [Vibrio]|uniref:pirin family protein n=1 Tax=Vibrio TaxID=662 RepID=UPI001BD653B7|nr:MULTISPECIES: pirin family protein [Vibrio]ELA7190453.1 pirin family protein [Vibrio alginolyticus]ELB2921283.1 pirin family protein [Vibrio alginolyticus]ELB2925397.1 pirin family protein [Vibrio alginolyticus]MBS9808416.1 pirin family protein [Vibrio alginolyticus]MBT0088807.1 pirin family protein [Vibrio alginolyticus]